MSALETSLDDVDALLVRKKKPGFDPVYHVPDPDDPSRPICNKNTPSGKGYRETDLDPRDLDDRDICGSCVGSDTSHDHRRRLDLVLAKENVTTIEEARKALAELDQ